MRRIRRFRALPPARQRLALTGLAVAAAVRIGLTVFPFARLHRLLARLGTRSATRRPHAAASVDDLAWAVSVGARHVPRATCLVQALALELLLVRSGRPAELRIGVAKENGGLSAHAWIETEGRRFLEDAEPDHFAALSSAWQN
jgi:Transglutaminase-like superfamily